MIFEENYIYAGKILKIQGYQGHFLINLDSFAKGYLNEKEPIFLEIDGIYVPFFIELFQEKGKDTAVIKFDTIRSDIEAEGYTGFELYIRDKNKKGSVKYSGIEDLIGFSFLDIISGIKGEVIEIMQVPGNPLIEIRADLKKSFIVPFNSELIEKIDIRKRTLVMKLPEGLTD